MLPPCPLPSHWSCCPLVAPLPYLVQVASGPPTMEQLFPQGTAHLRSTSRILLFSTVPFITIQDRASQLNYSTNDASALPIWPCLYTMPRPCLYGAEMWPMWWCSVDLAMAHLCLHTSAEPILVGWSPTWTITPSTRHSHTCIGTCGARVLTGTWWCSP